MPAWGWVDEPIFAEREGEVAFEIAFLEKYDVPLALLLAATHAARCGVAADQALLGEGLMREEEFYRLLARHLRAPYYCGEIKIGACRNPAETAVRGMARLAPNALGLRYVLAPRGAALNVHAARVRRGAAEDALRRHLAAEIGRGHPLPDGQPSRGRGRRRP